MPPSAPVTPAPMPGDEPAPRSSEVVLRLRGASASYGRALALSGVDLAVHRGERVALVGPSGAGKSTLLRLANTTLIASGGAVEVLGADPARIGGGALRTLRARVGTIWQQLHLVPQASVAENVRMGRIAADGALGVALRAFSAAGRRRVEEVLSRVGLAHKLDARLEHLSGGEQQRVAVARVLFQAPDLVLADEPLASVDPARAADVLALLLEAARGRTLVVSTHQVEPLLPRVDRVVGLRAGAVAFDLPPGRVGPAELAALYASEGARPSHGHLTFAPAREQAPAVAATVRLRVAASTLPGDHVVPRVLSAFRERHPEVHLALSVSDTAGALDALVGGAADLALVGARDDVHPCLAFQDVAEDEVVLIAPPGLRPAGTLGAAEVARLPRVDREPGSATRRVVEAQLAAMGHPLDPAASVAVAGSPGALERAVASGAGVGFASRLSVADALAAGRVRAVPVVNLRVPRRIYAAARRDAPPPAAAETLLALVAAACRGGRP